MVTLIAVSREVNTDSGQENTSDQYLKETHAFSDGTGPGQTDDEQHHADCSRAHILDVPDLRIVIGRKSVRQFFDRGIQKLNRQKQKDHRHEFDTADRCCSDKPRQRQRHQKRKQFLPDGTLGTDGKDQSVPAIDGGAP
jgi:hypothetical protein